LLIRYATIVDLPKWTKDHLIYSTDNENMMVTYDISDDFIEDYHRFLTGDYSKFSKAYKDQILNFWEANQDTLIYGVINKTGDEIKKFVLTVTDVDLDVVASDTEYWKPISLKEEIFGMKE